MDAKKTIKYLYEHGHIPQTEHFKTIYAELDKPITEHPDVQRLIGQVVELQAKNKTLRKALSEKGEYGYSQQVVDALTNERTQLQSKVKGLKESLIEYGTHGRRSDTTMCEKDKHNDYPCTCGFEQALKGN